MVTKCSGYSNVGVQHWRCKTSDLGSSPDSPCYRDTPERKNGDELYDFTTGTAHICDGETGKWISQKTFAEV